MRVCLVSGEYPPMQGGVGDYTRELARALLQLGHAIAVITSQNAMGPIGTAVSGAREPDVHPVVKRWNWASWTTVLRTASEFRADVLHIQYQTAAYGMQPAINLLPLRMRLGGERPHSVVTFHDLRVPYLFPKAGPVREWVTRCLARWSQAVITTNPEDDARLRQMGLPHHPQLIPIGSNIHPQLPAKFDRTALRQQLGVAPDETLLCYFGFLNESKGGETLFRTLAELVRRGHKARLLMIGGQVGASDPTNWAYLQHVKALADELGVGGRVLWTDFMPAEQVSAHFAAADVCVLPYRDGASYRRGSFMAALAHGLPIVSTQPRVKLPSLVDGENIRLVQPDDPSAAATMVEGLMADPALRQRVAAGAQKLSQEFTWDHIAVQTVELYTELVSKKQGQ